MVRIEDSIKKIQQKSVFETGTEEENIRAKDVELLLRVIRKYENGLLLALEQLEESDSVPCALDALREALDDRI